MKQKINHASITCIIAILILSAGYSNAMMAAETNRSLVEIRFIGTQNNQQIFQLVLNDNSGARYKVYVWDRNSNLLFSERLGGKKKSRNYKMIADDFSVVDGTRFEIVSMLTGEIWVYTISNSRRTMESIVTRVVQQQVNRLLRK